MTKIFIYSPMETASYGSRHSRRIYNPIDFVFLNRKRNK
ncbi:hypothetical protein LEP1GSC061_1177 [Leptospira wolffii serovar Khorat str. Khorat-H2]|nr:hypothetical protein LEP1GSC061_1177 [Leptospira wolffii serovar Khorat str. Khorat-H2]